MTARTAGDRERRRNLADASNTPLPALAGLLRRAPGQRYRLNPLASHDGSPDLRSGSSPTGTER
ncbi:hypothetical protein [Streptomyces sp. NPDC004042]|uniref:hypothetical protein n=1 Tax=Streptomyces sp. NPDC004042 TaxID=3154451 RepID=UPI0033AAC4CF